MPTKVMIIAIAAVIGLIVGFGVGYAVYQGQVSSLQTSLNQANESSMMLSSELSNSTLALPLSLQSGQMIHSGWVFLSPVGSGDYAVSLHVEGLEPSSAGAYIVEGVTRGAQMNMVPIGGNATSSEFDATAQGVGTYWTTVMQNPSTTYEGIDLVYLPGMNMTQATVVASVQLA
jgi:hypothetical protein